MNIPRFLLRPVSWPRLHSPRSRLHSPRSRLRPASPAARIARAGLTGLLIAGCGSSSGSKQLTLIAYSTPQSAYAKIIPAFQSTPEGKGWQFTQSYGASGDQSRAVLAGRPSAVVALSLAPDVTKLVSARLVSPSWNQDPYRGFVTDSVVVFTVRKGNPKHIQSWADLVRPGVQVVTPNPFTSGGARWNVMAAYGAQITQGKSPTQALLYVKSLFHNVVAQDKSARDELQTFLAGKGDVAITYENEAIGAQKKGQPVDYVLRPPEGPDRGDRAGPGGLDRKVAAAPSVRAMPAPSVRAMPARTAELRPSARDDPWRVMARSRSFGYYAAPVRGAHGWASARPGTGLGRGGKHAGTYPAASSLTLDTGGGLPRRGGGLVRAQRLLGWR